MIIIFLSFLVISSSLYSMEQPETTSQPPASITHIPSFARPLNIPGVTAIKKHTVPFLASYMANEGTKMLLQKAQQSRTTIGTVTIDEKISQSLCDRKKVFTTHHKASITCYKIYKAKPTLINRNKFFSALRDQKKALLRSASADFARLINAYESITATEQQLLEQECREEEENFDNNQNTLP